MSEVKKFDHVLYQGEVYFIANEVAKLLGYRNFSKTLRDHCKSIVKLSYKEAEIIGFSGKIKGMQIIPEKDVVALISKCRNGACESIKQALLDQMPNGNYIATVTRDEHVALKTIEQLLGISLIRQYQVDDYRVDGYHPESNTVYEVYEPYHNMCVDIDKERQVYIENKLGCNFVIIRV